MLETFVIICRGCADLVKTGQKHSDILHEELTMFILLTSISPISTEPGSNPDLHNEKPTVDCMGNGMAFLILT